MHVITAVAGSIAGLFLISKLTRRGKGKGASKAAVEPEVTFLPTIHEQDPSPDSIEATANLKRRASGEPTPIPSPEKEHKIKALKKDEPLPLPPTIPTDPEANILEAADAISIPSPPRPVASPPAASATVSSEFAADSIKESLFDELESQADSEVSSLSRNGSLKRLGSKVKVQFRKLSSRSSKGSLE